MTAAPCPPDNENDAFLVNLREQIDSLDGQLERMLAERAMLAQKIGDYKHEHGLPTYVPGRERAIIEGISSQVVHPFPLVGAQHVFREIISGCRSLEDVPIVAFLGPEGTFTEVAAHKVWGACAEFKAYDSLERLFEAMRAREALYGVVPIENSSAGTIRDVLDQLSAGGEFTIVGETYVTIHHCLLSQSKLEDIREVCSKDSALDQCHDWLKVNMPWAKPIPVASTAVGAEYATVDPRKAAIATELASERYGLPLVARNIEDLRNNRTRFFVLGHTVPLASGADKTSLLLHVAHQPGALVKALDVFRKHALNMTLIESRPSHSGLFEYGFFVDFEGHIADQEVIAAIRDLQNVCLRVTHLGSYPRAF